MNLRRLAGALAAGALWLGAAASAEAAQAVHVSCGDTITADTKLADDLTDCPNDGLVIGADDITLDLDGHTIDGDGVGDYSGIDNSAGHDGVTIERGSVRDFVEGVLVVGATRNRLRDLASSHQRHAGIFVAGSTDVDVEHSSSFANISGIVVADGSRDVRIAHNAVFDIEFGGIVVFESQNVRIVENAVSRCANDAGIGIFPGDHNRIERNAVSDSAEGIVLAFGSAHNVVRENSADGNFDGVIVDVGTDDNVVANNSLRHNDFNGVAVVGSTDNVVAQNSIVGDASEGGIYVLPNPDDPHQTSDRNLISRNTLVGIDADGILVEADQSQNVIELNRVRESADDGIDVRSAATTLTRNTANDNHDLGIEAVPGVTDAGGNRATGNGNPLQCTNVFCR